MGEREGVGENLMREEIMTIEGIIMGIKDRVGIIGEIVRGIITRGVNKEMGGIREASRGGQTQVVGVRIGGVGVRVQEEEWKIIPMS